MLQDEALDYIQEQYEEKNMVLAEYGESNKKTMVSIIN